MRSTIRAAVKAAPGQVRWLGIGELAIVVAGLVLALELLVLSGQSAATFQRDIPLASVAQEIQLDLSQAHLGVLELLDGDDDMSAETAVFGNLDMARANSQAMLFGGVTKAGGIQPLSDKALKARVQLLSRDLELFREMTRARLDDPKTNGEGSVFDQRYDALFEKLTQQTTALSMNLDLSISKDANRLTRLGQGTAGVVLFIGLGVGLLVHRHRRMIAVQTQQLARLASIVQSSGDSIASSTLHGVIRSWNPAAEQLYGYSEEEIVGHHAEILVPERLRMTFPDSWLPVIRREQTATFETVGRRKDGSEVPLALTVSPIIDAGVVTAVSVISRDISERLAKELELATARNEALEASRLKSQFLATMSHEIRTPLNGVIGLNALLLQTPLNTTQLQYAEGVESAGEALLAVINDILDFSKLEAGKVDFERVTFDPRMLLEEVAGLVAVPAHIKGLELLAFCSPEVPVGLIGDPGRIRQILMNLASNAVKFTASGEVLIKAELTDSAEGQLVVRFEVRDTGIGIAAGDRERLFESFSQADASTTRRYGGTGLGLAICQRLVTGMSGELGVDSEPGQGSTFWYSLPLEVAVEPAEPPLSPTLALLPGLRVLVVDDNATNRLILMRQLAVWQLRSDAVEDAPTALLRLQQAAASGNPYDIAVLDLLMPGMDGLELAQRKSADPALHHTRMIMLTSTAHVDAEALTEAGIAQWCTKPVRTSALNDRLTRLMAADRPAVEAPQRVPDVALPGSRGRILVVEDNEVNQLVAEGVVRLLGFDLRLVANGVEALAAVAVADFSAVLMDCHMPVMDGFEATRQIRRGEAGAQRIPIIAMTASALDEDRERCLAAGMDGYVTKPVSIEGLDAALLRWALPSALVVRHE
jgi:PAS domain S-box-containing protein